MVRLGILVALAFFAGLRPAAASDPTPLYRLIGLAEVITPDVSIEWGAGDTGSHFTYAWPMPLSLGAVPLCDRSALAFELRGEAQYRPERGLRGLGALRTPVLFGDIEQCGLDQFSRLAHEGVGSFCPGIYAEAGYLGGVEGHGPVFGGGVVYGGPFVALMAGYRSIHLDGERRNAVGLDLHIGAPLFGLFR